MHGGNFADFVTSDATGVFAASANKTRAVRQLVEAWASLTSVAFLSVVDAGDAALALACAESSDVALDQRVLAELVARSREANATDAHALALSAVGAADALSAAQRTFVADAVLQLPPLVDEVCARLATMSARFVLAVNTPRTRPAPLLTCARVAFVVHDRHSSVRTVCEASRAGSSSSLRASSSSGSSRSSRRTSTRRWLCSTLCLPSEPPP